MSNGKKITWIIGGLAAAFGVYWFLVRRKKLIAMNNNSKLSDYYSADLSKVVDAIYRLETNHYKSNIFQQTNGAGITAPSKNFPFGWPMLAAFWTANPDKAPTGIYSSENGWDYLKFPSVLAGQMAVAEIVKTRVNQGYDAAAYFNLEDPGMSEYRQKLLAVDPSLSQTNYVL